MACAEKVEKEERNDGEVEGSGSEGMEIMKERGVGVTLIILL